MSSDTPRPADEVPPAAVPDPHHPPGDAPGNEGPPISPLNPDSMHRAEDDAAAWATSPEFNDRPQDSTYTAPAATATPPSEQQSETTDE
jgi:hypothetical protein